MDIGWREKRRTSASSFRTLYRLPTACRTVTVRIRVSTIVREIPVISSSTVSTKRRQMCREPTTAFVVRDYTPVTPDGPVMSRPVSNGNDVTLAVRLRVLVHLERGADRVELWGERRAMVDAIRRGGRLVVAGLLVVVERSGLKIRLEIFTVRTCATADLVSTYTHKFKLNRLKQ